MNKKDLIAQVSQRTGLAPTIAGDVVDAVLGQIHDALRAGEAVRIQNFGTFAVKSRAARAGRNPRSGEALKIPALNSVRFLPAKSIKEQLKGTRNSALAGDPTVRAPGLAGKPVTPAPGLPGEPITGAPGTGGTRRRRR